MWFFLALLWVCLYAFYVFLWVRVVRKAGYGYWGLFSIVPVAALILLIVLAFAEWPIAERAKQMKSIPTAQ